MNNKRKAIILIGIGMFCLLFPWRVWAGMNVRTTADQTTKDFDVAFEALKSVYYTGEPIKFKIRANKTFYLYLFGIDTQKKTGYVLLPNMKQPETRYLGGKTHIVPGKEIEFFSNTPGMEKIVMMASTKKLDIDMAGYQKTKGFFTADHAHVLEQAKTLGIRSQQLNAQKATKEISLKILPFGNQTEGQMENMQFDLAGIDSDQACVFISSHKTRYREGEKVRVVYGADRQGYVRLFVEEPSGKRKWLKTQAVNGKEFYTMEGIATLPGGAHRLIALYDKDQFPDARVSNIDSQYTVSEKGIRLNNDQSVSFAVYSFDVTR